MSDDNIPTLTGSVPPGTPIRKQADTRLTARLGFSDDILIAGNPDHAVAWSPEGALFAKGAPAAMIMTLAAGASRVGESPPAAEAVVNDADAAMVKLAAAAPTTPHDAEDPLTFLSRVLDTAALRDWVLTRGLSGPHPGLWAHIADACGWQVPVPQDNPTSMEGAPDASITGPQGGESGDQAS